MTFQQRYAALERKFKAQVKEDNERFGWKGKDEGHYLPMIPPTAPVDFVLVGMEPSTARGADGTPMDIINLYAGVGDFALHFCASSYLCQNKQRYFITDLAKGAMPSGQARKTAKARWPKWYDLLKEEIELVANQNANMKVIPVGCVLEKFLAEKGTPNLTGSILHWSQNAAIARRIAPQLFPREYKEFSEAVSADDLVSLAEKLIGGKAFDNSRDKILRDLRKHGGTESTKMLMFTYKCQFAAIMAEPLI